MASPFPGMDPFLESHWRDVHARLVIYSCDVIQETLPRSLRARVEEAVLLEAPTGIGDHPLYPDVRVVEFTWKRNGGSTGTVAGAGVAVAEPKMVQVESQPATETLIEIIDRESGNQVVTVIEFLSPSNKSPGANREQYQKKQREICASGTNLVEIDLNRFGVHTLAFSPANLVEGRAAYMASVRRPNTGLAEVYSIELWQRLPTIKIPLRPTDADVLLDLQTIIDQCYRKGGYDDTLNYAVDPDPPLHGADKEWTESMLIEKGLRTAKKSPRRQNKPKRR